MENFRNEVEFERNNINIDGIYSTKKTTCETPINRQSKIGKKISSTCVKFNLGNGQKEDYLKEVLYPIRLNIMINKGKQQINKTVSIEINQYITIYQLIKEAVDSFNQLFEKEEISYRLNLDSLDNYQIRTSKKNGKPKNDLPVLNKESIVISTGVNSFSLLYGERNLVALNKQVHLSKCKNWVGCNLF